MGLPLQTPMPAKTKEQLKHDSFGTYNLSLFDTGFLLDSWM